MKNVLTLGALAVLVTGADSACSPADWSRAIGSLPGIVRTVGELAADVCQDLPPGAVGQCLDRCKVAQAERQAGAGGQGGAGGGK